MKCYQLWMLWHYGDVAKDIPPYKKLKPKNVPTQKMTLSRAAGVIKLLLKYASAGRQDSDSIVKLTDAESIEEFNKCMTAIIDERKWDTRAAYRWSYQSAYQYMHRSK